MTLKAIVFDILEKHPEARASDNELVRLVYERMNWDQTLKGIAERGGEFKFGTISRYRRKAVELNPLLDAPEHITKMRKARQEKIRREMHGL